MKSGLNEKTGLVLNRMMSNKSRPLNEHQKIKKRNEQENSKGERMRNNILTQGLKENARKSTHAKGETKGKWKFCNFFIIKRFLQNFLQINKFFKNFL